jgi:ParB family transcriptional regulator, chromosome partitioning protein
VSSRGLGRGLSSLIPTLGQQEAVIQELPIEQVTPNPDQPRKHIESEPFAELVLSVKRVGVLQPIMVRPSGTGYQIIAGERRWRAAREAGLESIPCRVMDSSETESLQLALVENLQREDLNPLEEARGYQRLIEDFTMTQAELADRVSKNRATITNALRLLDLPESIQEMLQVAAISAGHARALLGLEDDGAREKLAARTAAEGLSVREVENLVRLYRAGQTETGPRPVQPKAFKVVARQLRRLLGTRVRVRMLKDRGKIEIDFADEHELERIFGALTGRGEPEGSDT